MYVTTAKSVDVFDREHRGVARIPIEVDPQRTTVSPDGSRIYVTGDDSSLSIIDAVDHTVRTVARDASTAEVVGPKDNYLYTAHNEGRNCWVSVIAADGTPATVLPVNSYANALTVSPEGGRLYVASSRPPSHRRRGHGSVSLIDAATFTLIDTIAMRFAPDTITASLDGSALYATHYNHNAISAIELASHCHTLIALDDAPLDLKISPDGGQLYVTNLHSVALIDAATKSAETVPAGDLPRHLHISGDGTRAYVTDLRHNCVWVLDPVNKAIITTVDLGRKPEVLALSADERFLYTADHRAPTLSVVSLASSEGRPNPRR